MAVSTHKSRELGCADKVDEVTNHLPARLVSGSPVNGLSNKQLQAPHPRQREDVSNGIAGNRVPHHCDIRPGFQKGRCRARGRTSLGPGGGSHAGSAIAPIAVNAVLRVQPIALGRLRVVRHIGLTALNEQQQQQRQEATTTTTTTTTTITATTTTTSYARPCCYTASPSPIHRHLA